MVLVVPSFIGMFSGSLLVRKIGEGSKTTDAILFTAHHSAPVVTVLGLFVIDILLPWLGLFQNPSEAGGMALFLVFYTLMGFVIGLLLAATAVAYVLVAVLIGSVSGYVLAWAFTRGWETIERRGANLTNLSSPPSNCFP
ncbi:hypothetical protein [Haladaptatus cibarius]|uniref:hypothetical protein n=1 Tax=Haladaptatus cibarius TaxID=453847 RepID=UPI000A6F277F|nr:hypothetical protein [Haladaptatus cibarius]